MTRMVVVALAQRLYERCLYAVQDRFERAYEWLHNFLRRLRK